MKNFTKKFDVKVYSYYSFCFRCFLFYAKNFREGKVLLTTPYIWIRLMPA